MYPLRIAFDWTDEELKELQSLSLMNMLDDSDEANKFAENINFESGLTVVIAHGTGDSIGYKIFKNGKCKTINKPIEELAEELIESGDWSGREEVVLLACNAGTKTITSPAQELADQLQSLVWAPIGNVYFLKNGKLLLVKKKIKRKRKKKSFHMNIKGNYGEISFL